MKGFLYLLLYLTPTFKINQTLDLFGVELAICAAQPTSAVGMVLSQILHRRLNLQFVLALRTLLLLVNLETRTEKKKTACYKVEQLSMQNLLGILQGNSPQPVVCNPRKIWIFLL